MKYKVGDKVRIKSLDWYNRNKDNYGAIYAGNGFCFWKNMARHCGEIMKITTVKVDPEDSNKGYYFMENCEERWTDEMIEGLVEEETLIKLTGKPIKNDEMVVSINEYTLPEGYIFKDENGNVINATKIILEKKKKEVTYPKTYDECCDILQYSKYLKVYPPSNADIPNYDALHLFDLLEALRKLLICRDDYWKIAGEEMGLGKPWKPDWNDGKLKWCMSYSGNYIEFDQYKSKHHTLAFPTEEMRDAFYENFKELIESVKELL